MGLCLFFLGLMNSGPRTEFEALLQKKKFNIAKFFKLKNPFNITVNC
jgi:hypothetical protein